MTFLIYSQILQNLNSGMFGFRFTCASLNPIQLSVHKEAFSRSKLDQLNLTKVYMSRIVISTFRDFIWILFNKH